MDASEMEPQESLGQGPLDEGTQDKKPRRQVAFYPNMNSINKPAKPFSRSAAKRESVMALGSIEHLQHYFTKTGIAAETNPLSKSRHNLVPAIGGPNLKGTRQPGQGSYHDLELPPPPPEIVQPNYSPPVKSYEVDPDTLRRAVIEDLSAVEQAWWLEGVPEPSLLSVGDAKPRDKVSEHVDVLDMLRATTHAVRSVRNYVLALPDDGSSPTTTPEKVQFRSAVTLSSPKPRRQTSHPDLRSDPLTRVRRSALEVLGVLRALEEWARLPLSDEAYDAQSDHGEHASISGGSGSGSGGSHSRANSPSMTEADPPVSITYVQVGGKYKEVHVWEDEEDFDLNAVEEKRDRWEERLVLGGGYLYRQDIGQSDLGKEREAVAKYLDAVDVVLFGGRVDGKRGWVREQQKAEKDRRGKGRRVSAGDAEFAQSKRSGRRIVSTGMLDAMKAMVVTEEPDEMGELSDNDSIEDDELPDWAKRTFFVDDPLGRLRAFLESVLPSTLSNLLPPAPTNRTVLLDVLSSGQLLCIAYNTGVRRSRRPWGFVSRDAIHDIMTLETQSTGKTEQDKEFAKRSWTFRRTDNLRLWAAALKLRYNIPVVSPPSIKSASSSPKPGDGSPLLPSPTPSAKLPRTDEPPIMFDAPVVARRDVGWEDMLETLVLRWMSSVVDERRGTERN